MYECTLYQDVARQRFDKIDHKTIITMAKQFLHGRDDGDLRPFIQVASIYSCFYSYWFGDRQKAFITYQALNNEFQEYFENDGIREWFRIEEVYRDEVPTSLAPDDIQGQVIDLDDLDDMIEDQVGTEGNRPRLDGDR